MHELSLAISIIDELKNFCANKNNAKNIIAIKIKLGALSGIEQEALTFAFPLATEGTEFEKTKLIIEKIPAVFLCKNCNHQFEMQRIYNFRQCPKCNELKNTQLISGKEFIIENLVIET